MGYMNDIVRKLMTSVLTIIVILNLDLVSFNSHAEILTTYYHNDALGSPVAATNELGKVLWTENYMPYGSKVENQDLKTNNRIGYTGHEHDPDTGLTYMQARYYDPVLGRFYAVDPVGFVESNPLSFNRYAYANNNPYGYTDPDGQASKWVTGSLRSIARKLWTITPGGTSKVMKHSKFGKFYKSKSDGRWWSTDNAGHGDSAWKVFEEEGKNLTWIADADEYGTFIKGKHKGGTGLTIPMKELSSASMGESVAAKVSGALLTGLGIIDALDFTNYITSGDSGTYRLGDGETVTAEELMSRINNEGKPQEEDKSDNNH